MANRTCYIDLLPHLKLKFEMYAEIICVCVRVCVCGREVSQLGVVGIFMGSIRIWLIGITMAHHCPYFNCSLQDIILIVSDSWRGGGGGGGGEGEGNPSAPL